MNTLERDVPPYFVCRTAPWDVEDGVFTRFYIVAGPYDRREDAQRAAYDLDKRARDAMIDWQERTGKPMPWTNGTIDYGCESARDLDFYQAYPHKQINVLDARNNPIVVPPL